MEIKPWGVRGSCPSPIGNGDYENRVRQIVSFAHKALKKNPKSTPKEILASLPDAYRVTLGGNTTCIEVLDKDERLIIDLGTGARNLGKAILAGNSDKKNFTNELHICMTHTHLDHIQGWPFFEPAYHPAYTIHFYSCIKDLEQRLELQQNQAFFPIQLGQMLSQKKFHYIEPGTPFQIGTFTLETKEVPHPGDCISYKITSQGKSFIFATDTEFSSNESELVKQMQSYYDYCKDVNLLLMDGQYSISDFMERKGWGHNSMGSTIACAMQWGVKKLLITHHEPAYSDTEIWQILDKAKEMNDFDESIEVDLAIEGRKYIL